MASRAEHLNADTIPLDGFRLISRGKNLYIQGPDTKDGSTTSQGGKSTGTLNGVYSFLESALGIRWLMPGELGEFVPQRDVFNVPDIDHTEAPGFPSRRLEYVQNSSPLVKQWLMRNKQGSSLVFNHGHNWVETIEPNAFKAHPEWFAMLGGIRAAPVGRYKLETTNPALIRAFADRAIRAFRGDSALYSFSLSPSDSGNWSTSPESRALYDRDPNGNLSVTPLILKFYDDVAKQVLREMPHRLVCGYVYGDYLFPPSRGIPKLEKNVCLVVAPSFSYGYGLFRKSAQVDLARLIRAWSASTANLGYYDLPVTFQQTLGAPNPPGIDILKFLYPQLASVGVKEVYVYGVSGWGQGALTNYLLAKLNWNPRLDVSKLANEFLTLSYGARAGRLMEQFYGLLDSATKKYYRSHPEANFSLSQKVLDGVFVPIFPDLERLYSQAWALADEPRVRLRLRLLQMNLAVFRKYLSVHKLIAENRQSPFYLNESQIMEFVAAVPEDVTFALDPASLSPPDTPLSAITVRLDKNGDAIKPAIPNFLLRGRSRIVLYAQDAADVAITISNVTLAEDWVRYVIRSMDGTIVKRGDIDGDERLRFRSTANQVYFLDLYADSARYHLDIEGARFAIRTDMQERGLHLYRTFPPLYFYVPPNVPAFSVAIVSDKAGKPVGASLLSPKGERVAVMNTKERLVDNINVEGKNVKEGFWSIVWDSPWLGRYDDVWVQLDKKLVPWVAVDPGKRLIVQPVSDR